MDHGYYPFGGNKDSGMGREGIGYSIEEMTRLKTIVFNWKPAKVWADLEKERGISWGKHLSSYVDAWCIEHVIRGAVGRLVPRCLRCLGRFEV